MQRRLSSLFIVAYLGALGWGVAAHALSFLKTCHPAMYFLVWDMYSAPGTYELRYHVLAQGESGDYYELAPAPWSDIRLFGELSRHHYDSGGAFLPRIGAHTLQHTRHEPMHRLLIVEEYWNKKYNIPDPLWANTRPGPKQPRSYFHVRGEAGPDGSQPVFYPSWTQLVAHQAVMDNPRLAGDISKGHSIVTVPTVPAERQIEPASYTSP